METLDQEKGTGSTSLEMLAVVEAIHRHWPKFEARSAEAELLIIAPGSGECRTKIPVLAIVDQLECGDRYHLSLVMRKLGPAENFNPSKATAELQPKEFRNEYESTRTFEVPLEEGLKVRVSLVAFEGEGLTTPVSCDLAEAAEALSLLAREMKASPAVCALELL